MSRELWAELPYAKEAVELWHENGLTVEFLEGMTYNHRVQLVEAAHRYTRLDFDAIWDRYVLVDGRNQERLTEDELRKVIFGGDEE